MKPFLAGLLLALSACVAHAEDDARALLQRVITNRAAKDLALKARLFLTREKFVPVEILIQNRPTETRTLYRTETTRFLVVQPLAGEPSLFLAGTGELTGKQRLEKLMGSEFVYYDLGLPFLRWPDAKLLGDDRIRGRDCLLVESRATDQPYARVKLWLDKEYGALLRVEAFNADDQLLRRFAVTSFKRVGEAWIPRGLESATVPSGQALPAEERSRLDVYDGDYDAKLPAEWFDPARFAAP